LGLLEFAKGQHPEVNKKVAMLIKRQQGNAHTANSTSEMDIFWSKTISAPTHKAERMNIRNSSFFIGIAMIPKPQTM